MGALTASLTIRCGLSISTALIAIRISALDTAITGILTKNTISFGVSCGYHLREMGSATAEGKCESVLEYVQQLKEDGFLH